MEQRPAGESAAASSTNADAQVRPNTHFWSACAAYLVITIAMTWPVTQTLGTEIASDMGDPLFNCWVLMWTGGQVIRVLSGDWQALHDFWNGNIFYPQHLTIAYSEHLAPQMLQILPVYAVTHNIVLSYNVLFLSTFVLSAMGAYLLTLDLTRNRAAAFVGGLAFAFAPYRIAQAGHIQVLSAQWMPFALYAWRRYLDTRRPRALIGACAAVVAQVLSSGYYLLFFAPFVAIAWIFEIAQRRLFRDRRLWIASALAVVSVIATIWPFMSPYAKVREEQNFGRRSLDEVTQFSADTRSLGTSANDLWLWGETWHDWHRGEAEEFPGVTIASLAVIGLVAGLARPSRRWTVAFYGIATIAAIVLTFGPYIHVAGKVIAPGPYLWLYNHVPGFDGVRVPARYMMLAALFLAILAAFGLASLMPKRRATMVALTGAAALAILAESLITPFPRSRVIDAVDFADPVRHIDQPSELSPVYQLIRDSPGQLVLIEFPFGEPAYEIVSTFRAGYHRRPLVNGYSGYIPETYRQQAAALRRPADDAPRALQALRDSGATHAILHEAAFDADQLLRIKDWLTSAGARLVVRSGPDSLFRLQ